MGNATSTIEPNSNTTDNQENKSEISYKSLNQENASELLFEMAGSQAEETAPSSENDCLLLLETLRDLPSELDKLQSAKNLYHGIYDERKDIIKKLREMADYLEKTRNDVLIADRVGTGVGIGAGILFISGLIAAPFTAGASLALTVAGTTTGFLGGATSAGANITGHIMTNNSLNQLKNELKEHQEKMHQLTELVNDSTVLSNYTTRLRPTLEQLSRLSQDGFVAMICTAQKLVSHALLGNHSQINHLVDSTVEPVVKEFLHQLPINLDPVVLQMIAENLSQIMRHI